MILDSTKNIDSEERDAHFLTKHKLKTFFRKCICVIKYSF